MRLPTILIFSIITVICYRTTECAPFDQVTIITTLPSLEPKNHKINFLGLRHDHETEAKAKDALVKSLKLITGYDDIIIDSLNSNGATWHVGGKLSAADGGCPEAEIRQVIAKIQEPSATDFTHEFKMYIDEHFSKPHQVQVEWLGSCGNVARKRSQVELVAGPAITTTTIATPSSEANLAEAIAANVTTIVAITEEPTTPATTVATTPIPLGESTESGLNITIPTINTSLISSFTFAPMNFDSFPIISSTVTPSTTTTTTTTAIVTVTNDTETNTTAPTTTTTTTSTTPSLAPSSELPPIAPSSTPPLEEEATNELIAATTTTPITEATTTAAAATSTEAQAASLPGYGKYIGFCAAFLIFVAYLVCSRAYKRQGTYELHRE